MDSKSGSSTDANLLTQPVPGLFAEGVGLQIPPGAGQVIDTYWPSASDKTPMVIHVQDAHGYLHAQRNLAVILQYLKRQSDRAGSPAAPLVVGVEGAWKSVDLEWLHAFPDKNIRKSLAEDLLARAKISGEEYLSILEGAGFIDVEGVENEALYRENVALQKNIFTVQNRIVGASGPAHPAGQPGGLNIRSLLSEIDGLKSRAYPHELLALDKQLKRFEKNELSLNSYLSYLKSAAPGVWNAAAGPTLKAVDDLRMMESSFIKEKMEEERNFFIKELQTRASSDALSRLAAISIQFRLGSVGPLEYYGAFIHFGRTHSVDLPHTSRYVEYLKKADGITLENLQDSLKILTLAAQRDLSGEGALAGRVLELERWLKTQEKLWLLEMSPADWAGYRDEQHAMGWHEFRAAFDALEQDAGRTHPIGTEGQWKKLIALTQSHSEYVQKYFERAHQRDVVLAENAVKLAKNQKAGRVVLVAGGFHTSGIVAELRRSQIPYCVIRPSLSNTQGLSETRGPVAAVRRFDPKNTESLLSTYAHNLRNLPATISSAAPLPKDILHFLRSRAVFFGPFKTGDASSLLGSFQGDQARVNFVMKFAEGTPGPDSVVSAGWGETVKAAMGTLRQMAAMMDQASAPELLLQLAATIRTGGNTGRLQELTVGEKRFEDYVRSLDMSRFSPGQRAELLDFLHSAGYRASANGPRVELYPAAMADEGSLLGARSQIQEPRAIAPLPSAPRATQGALHVGTLEQLVQLLIMRYSLTLVPWSRFFRSMNMIDDADGSLKERLAAAGSIGFVREFESLFPDQLRQFFENLISDWLQQSVPSELSTEEMTVLESIRRLFESNSERMANLGILHVDVRVHEGRELIEGPDNFLLAPFVVKDSGQAIFSINKIILDSLLKEEDATRLRLIQTLVERELLLREFLMRPGADYDDAHDALIDSKRVPGAEAIRQKELLDWAHAAVFPKQAERPFESAHQRVERLKNGQGRIVHVAYEMGGFFKVGGVGDFIKELPMAMREAGHNVSIVLPGHHDALERRAKDTGKIVSVKTARGFVRFRILQAESDGVTVYLLANGKYFRQGYHPDRREAFMEAALFSRAAVEAIRVLNLDPDVVNSHDWVTGLVSPFLKMTAKPGEQIPATVFTIHNIGHDYQGKFPSGWFEELEAMGLPASVNNMEGIEYYGDISLIKGGLYYADKLVTVSPSYRNEILSGDFETGLDGLLRARDGDFAGIVNGIDIVSWDPQSDPVLNEDGYSPFDADEKFNQKARNKMTLQARYSSPSNDPASKRYGYLEEDASKPLLAVVTRLTYQKGMETILNHVQEAVDSGAQLVILGTANADEKKYEQAFQRLAIRYPGSVVFINRFDPIVARRIFAASDIFLIPSLFEPGGIAQQQAMRYGAIPIARAVGGLVDTIIDPAQSLVESTGFKFGSASMDPQAQERAYVRALTQALALYREQSQGFSGMQRRAMSAPKSWNELVPQYVKIYENAVDPSLVPALRESDYAAPVSPAAVIPDFEHVPTLPFGAEYSADEKAAADVLRFIGAMPEDLTAWEEQIFALLSQPTVGAQHLLLNLYRKYLIAQSEQPAALLPVLERVIGRLMDRSIQRILTYGDPYEVEAARRTLYFLAYMETYDDHIYYGTGWTIPTLRQNRDEFDRREGRRTDFKKITSPAVESRLQNIHAKLMGKLQAIETAGDLVGADPRGLDLLRSMTPVLESKRSLDQYVFHQSKGDFNSIKEHGLSVRHTQGGERPDRIFFWDSRFYLGTIQNSPYEGSTRWNIPYLWLRVKKDAPTILENRVRGGELYDFAGDFKGTEIPPEYLELVDPGKPWIGYPITEFENADQFFEKIGTPNPFKSAKGGGMIFKPGQRFGFMQYREIAWLAETLLIALPAWLAMLLGVDAAGHSFGIAAASTLLSSHIIRVVQERRSGSSVFDVSGWNWKVLISRDVLVVSALSGLAAGLVPVLGMQNSAVPFAILAVVHQRINASANIKDSGEMKSAPAVTGAATFLSVRAHSIFKPLVLFASLSAAAMGFAGVAGAPDIWHGLSVGGQNQLAQQLLGELASGLAVAPEKLALDVVSSFAGAGRLLEVLPVVGALFSKFEEVHSVGTGRGTIAFTAGAAAVGGLLSRDALTRYFSKVQWMGALQNARFAALLPRQAVVLISGPGSWTAAVGLALSGFASKATVRNIQGDSTALSPRQMPMPKIEGRILSAVTESHLNETRILLVDSGAPQRSPSGISAAIPALADHYLALLQDRDDPESRGRMFMAFDVSQISLSEVEAEQLKGQISKGTGLPEDFVILYHTPADAMAQAGRIAAQYHSKANLVIQVLTQNAAKWDIEGVAMILDVGKTINLRGPQAARMLRSILEQLNLSDSERGAISYDDATGNLRINAAETLNPATLENSWKANRIIWVSA